MTATLFALSAAEMVAPAALAIATGQLLDAATHRGGTSFVGPLLLLGLLLVVPIPEARWRVSDQLGMRVGDQLDQRLMEATLGPAGLAHLDDPAVQDDMNRAATFWNSSLLEGVTSVVIVRLSGALAVLVLARAAGWLAALAVGAAWATAGWWSWRVAGRGLDAQFDKGEELREVEYVTEVALAPNAGKDVRVYGLGPWFVRRQLELWSTAMAPLWASRRRHVPASAAVTLGVAAVHLVVVALLVRRTDDPGSVATAMTALVGAAGLGEIPYGHYEMEFGLRTVPANDAVVRAVAEPRFALPGHRPADGLPTEAIRLEGVSFTYPTGTHPVLEGVDLDLPAGTSTALVGLNGAGKSTLVKLLCRFYDPTAGRITVDGVDLRDLDARAWQQRVAGLFQEFVRYPLSALDNIALRPEAVDDPVHRDAALAAARLAGIADELHELPDGIDTMVTRAFNGGAELSGGQWQRLALARAIFATARGAGLLILDEPTAHLDARAESELYDRFLDVTGGVTTVLVSHRFSTVRRADRVAVIDGGRVTETGSHDELMDLGGTYARLFTIQAARFNAGAAE
jgi:ATP-binding cassette subfamily B protein